MCFVLMRTTGLVEIVKKLRWKGRAGYVLHRALVSVLNFSFNPRIDLIAVIFIVGCLIVLKGVIAKQVYKNWL